MLYSPKPMHLPDGFLSLLVSLGLWIVAAIIIGIALKKTNKALGEREVPLMGVTAAAIFAGQMLNFSVAGGTSGHLLGAALAVILLGLWPAVLVMTSVVAVQALLFQDGGILALGANIFNMAIIGPLVAYAVFTLLIRLFRNHPRGLFAAGFAAAWASIFVASLACGLELAISGTSPANIAIPAMGAIHALIGIGEALITTGALAFIMVARKDLLQPERNSITGSRGILIGGSLITLLLVILSPLASSHPDGLEWVAQEQGFLELARTTLYTIFPEYSLPGISNPALATIAAGILGAIIVVVVAFGISRMGKQTNTQESTQR
jgi:cobalt/nickel transport system permease protein